MKSAGSASALGRYCSCESCLKGVEIINPYEPFERELKLTEFALPFDGRTSLLCRIGCNKYGKKPTCPPHIPESQCYERIFASYTRAFVVGRRYPYADGHFTSHWRTFSTNEVHDLLLRKERLLFAQGHVYAKAFIGGSCKVCAGDACSHVSCRLPHLGRVPLEATGINVYALFEALNLKYQEPPADYFWRVGIVLAE